MSSSVDLDTGKIREWRSIVTLVVFIATNITVLFPFHIPIPIPRLLYNGLGKTLRLLRIVEWKSSTAERGKKTNDRATSPRFVWTHLPVNFLTAPLAADLFLLAISAIGRKEVHDGTVGADHIFPIDIMLFFITLAYIAISLDASGLIRWLAFKVLQRGSKNGPRLYLYLYAFFAALATLIGNDPIILSGTPFLAYMTRVSANIHSPKAWIYAQFAIANVASAILVSSNPTNLVLAGAFNIKFIVYTANAIVPVVVTIILLLPFLLYVVFRDSALIPASIEMHTLPDEVKSRVPANPNIPYAKGAADMDEGSELTRLSTLEEIMNPHLDKGGAIFGSVVMGATLVTILAINASSHDAEPPPAYWVTVPAAFIMFCFDLGSGWVRRHTTRELAMKGKEEVEKVEARRAMAAADRTVEKDAAPANEEEAKAEVVEVSAEEAGEEEKGDVRDEKAVLGTKLDEKQANDSDDSRSPPTEPASSDIDTPSSASPTPPPSTPNTPPPEAATPTSPSPPPLRTLATTLTTLWFHARCTFPTTTTVLSLLPLPLVPFALCMFILVQALSTTGWIPLFAHAWTSYIHTTGALGAIGGMAFLSVALCNFAGTNIGTTILLCRIVQAWLAIEERAGNAISERVFWGAVYSLAICVNYGAFSWAFSASLAGMLWRDILGRKGIAVGRKEFVWVNLPICAFAVVVASVVLVGEVWVVRGEGAYTGS